MEKNTYNDDVLEILTYLKDHAVTKEEFDGLQGQFTSLDGKVSSFRGEFDEFKKNTEESFLYINARLDIIQRDIEDIKIRLLALEKRTQEDADIAAKEIIELKQRVSFLEQQVKRLQAA